MIVTLKDTNAAAVAAAVAKARRNLGAGVGLVLTLVVVVEEAHYEEALKASLIAGREHPSRILIVVRGKGRKASLDAEIRTGEGDPGDVVTLRMSGELVEHEESVVLPLLLPDLPVVVWWPNSSPERPSQDPIGALADRRITDAAGARSPLSAMLVRARHHEEGDTDLTWTRLTQWRALLAAALDQFPCQVDGAVVEADRSNAPAELMAAWLQARLDVPAQVKASPGPGITAVRLVTAAGDVEITRHSSGTATYSVPGQPRRSVALKRRTINELLTEELRRMDSDDIFNEACAMLVERADTRTKASEARKVARAEKAQRQAPADREPMEMSASAPRDEEPGESADKGAKAKAPARKAATKTASRKPATSKAKAAAKEAATPEADS